MWVGCSDYVSQIKTVVDGMDEFVKANKNVHRVIKNSKLRPLVEKAITEVDRVQFIVEGYVDESFKLRKFVIDQVEVLVRAMEHNFSIPCRKVMSAN